MYLSKYTVHEYVRFIVVFGQNANVLAKEKSESSLINFKIYSFLKIYKNNLQNFID